MNSTGIFTHELPIAIGLADNVGDAISDLVAMIKYSKKSNTNYLVDECSLYNQNVSGISFAEWLRDKSDGELRDVKRELEIELRRKVDITGQPGSVLGQDDVFSVGKPYPQFVWCIDDFLMFKQARLARINSPSKFAQELPDCFRYIFFDKDISATLKTLNAKFISIRNEIIEHLRKLDGFYEDFRQMREENDGFDFRKMSDAFTKHSGGIECAPQGDRKSTKGLVREYEHEKTKTKEKFNCELHTKFKKRRSIRDRDNQDRLYFHPGKEFFCHGKIIVIHIGTHM